MERYTLRTLNDTLATLKKNIEDIELEQEEVGLEHLFGRYSAEDIHVNEDIPGFDRASTDGYAIISGDTFGIEEEKGRVFTIIGRCEIGEECKYNLGPNECIHISEGAMIPPNADSVVSMEDIELIGPSEAIIRRAIERWENVVRKGDDIKKGEVLIKKGAKIGVREMGALSGAGLNHIKVNRKLKVGIISTGVEIVEAYTRTLQLGKMRDINSHMVCDAVKSFGGVPINLGIVKDNSGEMEKTIAEGLDTADILVITGGSAQGTMDKTLSVIKRIEGVEILTDKIAIEPGSETIIARVYDKIIMGLPGNPISALIVLNMIGRSLISWINRTDASGIAIKAKYMADYKATTGREEYILVNVERNEGEYIATPVRSKKGFLTSLLKGNAYIRIRASDDGIKKGEEIEAFLLSNHFMF